MILLEHVKRRTEEVRFVRMSLCLKEQYRSQLVLDFQRKLQRKFIVRMTTEYIFSPK